MNGPIILASDHRGATLTRDLRVEPERAGYEVLDLGTHDGKSVD